MGLTLPLPAFMLEPMTALAADGRRIKQRSSMKAHHDGLGGNSENNSRFYTAILTN
jgi:hypothetical protein